MIVHMFCATTEEKSIVLQKIFLVAKTVEHET